MKPVNERLNGLDHLRAFAIVYVFLTHYGSLFPHPAWVEPLGDFGWTGVDLFFVLSGYLIGGELLREAGWCGSVSIGRFYLKRFFRIIPAYLAVVGLYFLVPGFAEAQRIPPLWKFLTFTQNLGLSFVSGRAFSHAWSLCVEEHFYLVLPLLVAATVNRPRSTKLWLAGAVVLGGLTIRAVSWAALDKPIDWPSWFEWIYYPSYTRLDGLVTGVCIAAMQIFTPVFWERVIRQWRVLALAGLTLLVAAYFLCADRVSLLSSVVSFPLIAAGYGCLVIAAVSPVSILHRTRLTATSVVAAWSYSLYLTHKGVIHVSQQLLSYLGMSSSGTAAFFIVAAIALLFAGLIRVVIERPFMRIRAALLVERSSLPLPQKTN